MTNKPTRGLPAGYRVPKADQSPIELVSAPSRTNGHLNGKGQKFALIHIGTDEVYGLEYVAAELKRNGHEIRWFDGDSPDGVDQVIDWQAQYMCFSPLTTFFPPALEFSRKVKAQRPQIKSVFGGHHVTAAPDVYDMDGIDIVVSGPVYGTVDKIVESNSQETLKGHPVPMEMMTPSRREYFEAIPLIGGRHRKTIMSHFGCPYNCSYCSISRLRTEYSWNEYRKYWLTRRPIEDIIEEAKIFLEFPTKEVALEDDDMLYGDEINEWLPEFKIAWKQEIGLPIFGNVTPKTVVKVSDKTLETMAELVAVVQMGVQADRSETLKLFNRQFQNENQVAAAVKRLTKFGIPVKLELIVGNPVPDPVGDAIDTLKLAQRVSTTGSFVVAFPLMLYPGTALHKWCVENNIAMRDDCTYEFYGGTGSILFDSDTQRKITNITKLASFFVKYNVDERWIRALIEMDLNDTAALRIGETIFYESLRFRLGEQIDQEFDNILAKTKLRY
jgi:radical SAM superfamily enzyme YgiQ (UPF0313 family)